MERKEQIVREYFQSWLSSNREGYDEIFDEKVTYSECYGPKYHGLDQIKRWFDDWNEKGKVHEWTIKRVDCTEQTAFVEWYFKCIFENETSDFDGCSIIDFNGKNQIVSVKEFESKAEHTYPYGE